MTEDEAKKKECPQHLLPMLTLQIAARRDGADSKTLKEIEDIGYCSASECAMWEPECELESKQIVKGEKIPNGWHVVSNDINYKQTIGRYIEIKSGDCSLKSKENGCFYPG